MNLENAEQGKFKELFQFQHINYFLCSLLTVFLSVQALFLLGYCLTFFPQTNNMHEIFLPNRVGAVHLNREMFLFRAVVIFALVIQFLLIYFYRKKMSSREFFIFLIRKNIFEGALSFLMLVMLFQMVLYNNLILIQQIFMAALICAGISKIFWVHIDQWIDNIFNLLSGSPRLKLIQLTDIMIPIFIILVIFIPDREGLKSLLFSIDHFYHIDSFIMAPAWAYLKGNILNVDAYSIYGVGMPIVISRLAQMLGGYSYENVLTVMLCLIIVYFILFYGLLRLWTGSVIISCMGILIFLKLQIFNINQYILLYPARSAVRFFFDVFFLFFIWKHSEKNQKRYLYFAGFIAGVTLSYMNDIGVYLLITFYSYLIIKIFFIKDRMKLFGSIKGVGHICGILTVPFGALLLSYSLMIGKNILNPVFWINTFRYLGESSSGYGAEMFYENIENGHYFAFFMGCIVLITYIISLVYAVGWCLLNFSNKHNNERGINDKIFIIILCVYGLCLYHYYIWRSVGYNYYVVIGPLILILCYWIKRFTEYMPKITAIKAKLIFLTLSIFAIFSTHFFIQCPNILNLSSYSFQYNKAFMVKQLSIKNDVRMIKELTSENQPVCLISSFEPAILMEADRKPFFYEFQTIKSAFFRDSNYQGTTFSLKKEQENFMLQLRTNKPEYVFLEKKILLTEEMLKKKDGKPGPMHELIQYLKSNYQIFENEQNLLAMKRKIP